MPPLTIFIIDDTPASRSTMRLAAELVAAQLGRELVLLSASSGVEAVQILGEGPHVDLVVLDIHMSAGDVDGRLLASLIRDTLPSVPILPFTGDRTEQLAAHLVALGLGPPVHKPIDPEALAERMRQSLELPPPAEAMPLQGFLAEHTLQLAAQLAQRVAPRPTRVAILARDHLARLGIERILDDVRRVLPLETVVANGNRDTVLVSIQQGAIDLLVAAPDAVVDVQAIQQAYGTPVLIYARISEASAMLIYPYSLVVGPTTSTELATAIQQTLQGQIYRDAALVALLALAPRQRSILRMLARGDSFVAIGMALGVSDDRVRHLTGKLYDQLQLPHSRPALIAWAQSAPLHLFDE